MLVCFLALGLLMSCDNGSTSSGGSGGGGGGKQYIDGIRFKDTPGFTGADETGMSTVIISFNKNLYGGDNSYPDDFVVSINGKTKTNYQGGSGMGLSIFIQFRNDGDKYTVGAEYSVKVVYTENPNKIISYSQGSGVLSSFTIE
jgi:hypothetical protein